MVKRLVIYSEIDERTGEIISGTSEKQFRQRMAMKIAGESSRREREGME